MHIAVETQPICPYCHRLISNPNHRNRQKCCMKAKCLSRHRAAQREHALIQKREYMKNRYKKGPNLNHVPLGLEDGRELSTPLKDDPSLKEPLILMAINVIIHYASE